MSHHGETVADRQVGHDDWELSAEDADLIPVDYRMLVLIRPDNNGWTAIALPFNVAGWGITPESALKDLRMLVYEYLRMGFREGLTFDEQRRRAPLRFWLIALGHALRFGVRSSRSSRDHKHRRSSIWAEVPLSC